MCIRDRISKGIQKDLEVDDYNYIYQHCLKPDDYLKSLKNHQKGYFKMLKVNHAHDHLKKDLFQDFSIMGLSLIHIYISLHEKSQIELI